MRIPENILDDWNNLKSTGDMAKIARIAKVSKPTVSRAFNDEVCSDHLFNVMAKYFAKKRQTLESILQDYQN